MELTESIIALLTAAVAWTLCSGPTILVKIGPRTPLPLGVIPLRRLISTAAATAVVAATILAGAASVNAGSTGPGPAHVALPIPEWNLADPGYPNPLKA